MGGFRKVYAVSNVPKASHEGTNEGISSMTYAVLEVSAAW